MKNISCGVLITFDQNILLGHSTGNAFWDIPKGMKDEGETELEAAIRETREETGLKFEDSDLIYLGRFEYNHTKDLALFRFFARTYIRPEELHCTSTFVDKHGNEKPELDEFSWFHFATVKEKCAFNMGRVLDDILNCRYEI